MLKNIKQEARYPKVREKVILCIFFVFLLRAPSIFADLVYFKNGKVLGNVTTKEDEKGIWIYGVLFEKQEIDKIEQRPVVKAPAHSQPDGSRRNPITSPASSSDINARIKKRAEEEKRRAELAARQAKEKASEAKRQEEYQNPQATSDSYSSGMKKKY